MSITRHSIGVDVSTQSVSATVIGVTDDNGAPLHIRIIPGSIASRPCRDFGSRRDPACWARLVRECLDELKAASPIVRDVECIGVSTTFPGIAAVGRGGAIDPGLVSLYDNTHDAGICSGAFEHELAEAELQTMNRMYPGNMLIGLAHLLEDGLRLDDVEALVPPNTAFYAALLREAGVEVDPRTLLTDLTQAVIGCLYDARTGQPMPDAVRTLTEKAIPGIDVDRVAALLPRPAPAWRNVLDGKALDRVRAWLDLPKLSSIAIGAGDSAMGALALMFGQQTIVNVRGSSDSPMLVINELKDRLTPRETVLHYPVPTAPNLGSGPWCAVAPILRTGKVWDWVRRLGFSDDDPLADSRLEALATDALLRRLSSGGVGALRFNTALGGERAPDWDPAATGSILGITESHGIGDIAVAALEGVSHTLRRCVEVMETRYGVQTDKLVLAGEPTTNRLWNWITAVFTGKRTLSTAFADASILGAALVGYASLYDGRYSDAEVSARLLRLTELAVEHEVVGLTEVQAPNEDLAALASAYRLYASRSRLQSL